jgi:hypothetical protein
MVGCQLRWLHTCFMPVQCMHHLGECLALQDPCCETRRDLHTRLPSKGGYEVARKGSGAAYEVEDMILRAVILNCALCSMQR